MEQWSEDRIQVPPDHPVLAGHFPGRPIVPGAMLLEAVLTRATALLGVPVTAMRLRRAKFIAPLLPGECATVTLERGAGRCGFRIERDGATLVSGALEWDPHA